jgi:hypothetical protein
MYKLTFSITIWYRDHATLRIREGYGKGKAHPTTDTLYLLLDVC